MARRRKKKDDNPLPILVLLIPIGLVLYGSHIPPFVWILIALGLALTGWIWWDNVQRRRKAFLAIQDVRALSPRDFELWVAAIIQTLPGWRAEATQASADQGADVIATSSTGKRIAIQVKHYSKSVGNGAVQEITAARAFYRATEAVVVTSGPGYTKAAVELARANGVQLWTLQEMFQLRESGKRNQQPPARLLTA